jgi:hypothetical protein
LRGHGDPSAKPPPQPVEAPRFSGIPADDASWRGQAATGVHRALLPYKKWPPRRLPGPDTAPRDVIASVLREIVAVEGPMPAQLAYRIYTHAAGARRVGPEMARRFQEATRIAVQDGLLRELGENVTEPGQKTLYVPGGPSVMVRALGPRALHDVPRSEIAKLIQYLRVDGAAPAVVKRAVLDAYGLIRMTAKTSRYLDECLSYQRLAFAEATRRPPWPPQKSGRKSSGAGRPDEEIYARQRRIESLLSRLSKLIDSGCTREEARRGLSVSDSGLDALLKILQYRTNQKVAFEPIATRSAPGRATARKRACTKCGRSYAQRQGGTRALCGICYEKQQRFEKGSSVQAIPSSFESSRRRH